MAYINQIPIEQADGATAEVFASARERAGQVANIIRVMGHDGKSAAASMAIYVSLMKSNNSLSAAQREMLAAVVSNANDCFY